MNNTIKNMFNSGILFIRKNSPKIMIVGGVLGGIGSAIMACKATMNLSNVIEEHKDEIEFIQNEDSGISEEDLKKKKFKIYLNTGVKLIKLYGPSLALGTTSTVSILSGCNILHKRNAALSSAYLAIDSAFKKYRGRIKERYGEEVDFEIRNGVHTEKITVVETDENGKEKKVKKSISVVDGVDSSDYSRYFAYKYARAAEKSIEHNKLFLKMQLECANRRLINEGFLFLNSVYEMLGYEKTTAGQYVGWVYDKNNTEHGDNYVDFGVKEAMVETQDGSGEYETVLILDFNVDGLIIDHAVEKGLMTTI